MKKIYKIAGLMTSMETFGRTFAQALPYMIDNTTEIQIQVKSDVEKIKESFPNVSIESLEYLASGKSFFSELLDYNGMMLHSSALVMNDKAYLFSADPGTGKSTHVCLWRRVFGDENVRVLNDDKPALRLEEGIWYAYGTPWSGKTGQNLNLRVPLGGIAYIERGLKNEIEHFNGIRAVQALLGQTSRLDDPALRIKQLELLDKLMTQVPIWKLKCNMEPEAAIVAYEAMSGQKWRKDV